MIRETTDDGAKQAAVFSNMSNVLRHEVRYATNGLKQVNSFFKPSPIWLRMQRQGDWIFSYYSADGVNFQYVHGVHLPMQSCVEFGLASFTFLPNAQTESVFSNISISGSNGSFSEEETMIGTKLPSTTLNLLSETANDEVDLNPLPNKADKHSRDNTAQTWPGARTPLNHYIPTPINLYPNPNNGQFILQMDEQSPQVGIITIYNPYGQQIYQQPIEAGFSQKLLDLGPVPAGMYLLEFRNETTQRIVKKFTISR